MTPRELVHRQWSGSSLLALLASFMAVAAGIGSCTSVVASKVGVSLWGAPEAFAQVHERIRTDSTYANTRMDVHDQRISNLDQRLSKMERVVEIWTYVQCAQLRTNARPRSCTEVLSQ